MATKLGFRQASRNKSIKEHFKVCFCFKRMFRLKVAEPPEEINNIFDTYTQNGTMNMDELYNFLVHFQGEERGDDTKKHAQAVFHSLRHLNIFQRRGLHFDAFFRYLLGDLNGPLRDQVHHDMNSPLAHYFLYTGHNSYLTGNQFSSESSTTPIIKALKKGVRVIELDLWPNSREDDVDVRHGGTLTSSVKLRDCLNAIRDNAFEASDYPLIITFEDHITPPLQRKVAKMVDDIFGDMLFRPDYSHQMKKFPSPESLKGKILISTKPPESPENQGQKVQEEEVEWLEDKDDRSRVNDEDESDGESEEEESLEYRNLISIHAWKPKGKVEHWLLDHDQVRRLSLSEQVLEDIARTRGTDIVRFTQNNLLRVYPKGSRMDSSNYDPMTGWMHGAQMVAFNMQGHGHFLWYMEGMFKANGGCGYVKKPDILLNNSEIYDSRVNRPIQKTLQVLVYMGEGWQSEFGQTHFDFYSPPDFRVQVGIHGVPADIDTKVTRTIEDEWVPVWIEELNFPLTCPELALLHIKVIERDFSGQHDFAGQTCLPVSELREGIRSVRLCNRKGEPYKHVRLLVQFRFSNH
ncbi:phosphoinositide phospholipase C 1-like [Cicer arietinum]|uniref:Phosphoinositide phospholipase C n=1 Tax=Cicer arietinum TaxID=3827 RepID=A0A1S2XMK2_CICAR|nr:phosphoinositide phospholipase C 1-like [Cicer arietinum]